jgi:transposase
MYAAPDGDTAHRRLVAFYEWAVTVEVDEITRLARTIDTWQDEVLAFFDTRLQRPHRERQRQDRGCPAGT